MMLLRGCTFRHLTLVLMVLICWAQTTIANEQSEQISKALSQLSSVTLVHGEFKQQKNLAGLDHALQSEGNFIFWKNQGLYLENNIPFFNATTMTLDSMIQWNEDGSSVALEEKNGVIQREINKTLLAFFSADLELIRARFHTQWQFTEKGWTLTLVPQQAMVSQHMKDVTLQGDTYLTSLLVRAGNGDSTEMKFSNVQENKAPTYDQCRRFYLDNIKQHCAAYTASAQK